MRIVIPTPWIPFPPDSGANRRTLELARRLAARHEVTFAVATRWPDQDEAKIAGLRGEGFEVVARPGDAPREVAAARRAAFLRGHPMVNAERGSRPLEDELARLVSGGAFDVVQIEHTDFGRLPFLFRAGGPAVVALHFHDRFSESYRRMARLERSLAKRWRRAVDAAAFRRLERRLPRAVDLSIVTSERDAAALARDVDRSKVLVVPNCADLRHAPLPETGNGAPVLLFVGHMDYLPNADAAVWLVREIFPRLRAAFPRARLLVVGGELPRDVVASNGVDVAGVVPDVRPYYSQADVAIVPLRAGGGTRLKILEAMAMGRPVVSTALGAEGLAVRHDEHLLLAESTAELADAVGTLIRDADRRRRLVTAARAFVERHHSWRAAGDRLCAAYEALLSERRGGRTSRT